MTNTTSASALIPWERDDESSGDEDFLQIQPRRLGETHTNSTSSSPRNSKPTSATPLPKFQLFILLWLQLAEPVVALVIFPFINELIISLGITHGDDRKTGLYIGLMESTFFACEFLTIFFWGRLSDQIGRRPVLLTGAIGMTLSIMSFGLSKTYAMLIVSRALSGLLNGNIGVCKAMVSEITDPSNFDQAISWMPVVWCTGATLGPVIGGSFAKPYRHFPRVFSAAFWRNHPYFLSCLVAALFPLSAFGITAVFLKETVRVRSKDKHDSYDYSPLAQDPEYLDYAGHDQRAVEELGPKPADDSCAPPLRELLTYPVLCATLNYGCLALVDVAYVGLIPLFFASKPSAGGLGWSPLAIGCVFGVQGLINGVVQVTAFPPLRRLLGAKALYRLSISCYLLIFTAWPLMHWLVVRKGSQGGLGALDFQLWIVLAIQLLVAMIAGMGYSCIFIFITAAAPSPKAIGSTTGLSQTVSSFMRAAGPASMASLFAFSIQNQHIIGGYMVYVVLLSLTILAISAASLLPGEPAPSLSLELVPETDAC